ncbi:hypothetical protein ACSBR2_031033 [Camellia fascicularis]
MDYTDTRRFQLTINSSFPCLCKRIEATDHHIFSNSINLWNTSDVFWEAISNHQVLSLYQGLGTKKLQSVIFSFIYFYGYSLFKKLYLKRSGSKSIGMKANLVLAATAGACTIVVAQPLNTTSSRMQTTEFGKSKTLWKSLSENTWSEAFDGLCISLLLTANPSIQVYSMIEKFKQNKSKPIPGKERKKKKS